MDRSAQWTALVAYTLAVVGDNRMRGAGLVKTLLLDAVIGSGALGVVILIAALAWRVGG